MKDPEIISSAVRLMEELSLCDPRLGNAPIACPCLRMAFYLDAPAAALASEIGNTVRQYVEMIPAGAIRARVQWDGEEMEIVPFDAELSGAVEWEYRADTLRGAERHSRFFLGSEGHTATGYSITTLLSDTGTGTEPKRLSYLEFNVPLNFVREQTEVLVSFFRDTLRSLPCQTATASCSIDFNPGVEPFIRSRINRLLMRFVGLDGCYRYYFSMLRDRVPLPGWLTFVNDTLFRNLPEEARTRALTTLSTEHVGGGSLLRSSALPPLGDVNRGAKDIGRVPELASALAPILLKDPAELKWMDMAERERWVQRFDAVVSADWFNEELVPY